MKTAEKNNISWIIGGSLILAAAFSRLIPHPYNFSPIAGMALLGGATIGRKAWAFILPVGALFLSDLAFQLFTGVPGFYGWGQVVNYGAFALIVVLGMTLLRRIRVQNIILASVAASALFFVLSNFGVWLFAGGMPPYTHDGAGLLNTFLLGIPFFGNTVAGDLVYTGLLFGAYTAIAGLLASRKRIAA